MGYHSQLAWYRNGAAQNGLDVDGCFTIAVETKPPHCVTVMQMTENALRIGEKRYSAWMERLKICEAADEWPGYVQDVVPFDVWDDQELVFEEDEEGT